MRKSARGFATNCTEVACVSSEGIAVDWNSVQRFFSWSRKMGFRMCSSKFLRVPFPNSIRITHERHLVTNSVRPPEVDETFQGKSSVGVLQSKGVGRTRLIFPHSALLDCPIGRLQSRIQAMCIKPAKQITSGIKQSVTWKGIKKSENQGSHTLMRRNENKQMKLMWMTKTKGNLQALHCAD